MNPAVVDYFGAESAIIARLTSEVVALQRVLTPFDLNDMLESSQGSPVAHVIYSGDTLPGDSVGAGESRMVAQRWLVVLAVRSHAAQLQDTKEIRNLAGPIIPDLLRALQGWQPVPWMRPLKRISGPPAGYSATFAYFPFMFEGRIIT